MILNPYYYVFSKIYKKLKSINVQDEGILFSSYAVLFMIFIPHFFILLFKLKDYEIFTFNINVPKQLFGVGFALSFWLINHLLIGWKNRYFKIVTCYEKASKTVKNINLVLLLVYFSIPFILMIVF
jgi:hypothetical protein